MNLYVLKFGGSSVATTSRIKHASQIVSKLILEGNRVVVVTSAMQGVTNQLIDFTKNFQDCSMDREYDSVISSGEQVAAGLFAMCLNSMGYKAVSMAAWQIPIKTDGVFSNAYISSVGKSTLMDSIDNGIIPVIAGFQGISENAEIMTIGRGGSDATACAIAYAIGADECFIYTDVDGIYTADPRIVLDARRLEEVSYEEMLELASHGAKVLQSKSVLIAKQCNVKLRVLSSFSEGGETKVTNQTVYMPDGKRITGIAHNPNMAKITISAEDTNTTDLLNIIHQNKMQIDLVSCIGFENKRLAFLAPKASLSHLKTILENIVGISFEVDNDIGVVTVVGSGIKTDQSVLPEIISVINNNSVKIKQIEVSELSVSIVVPLQQLEHIVNILHKALF